MHCDHCKRDLERNRYCSKCKLSRYCSVECQTEDWPNHKKLCIDRNKLEEIIVKCDKQGLIRHINGNTLDNRAVNLAWVKARDALKNKDWTVDTCLHLDDQEFEIWSKAQDLLFQSN